MTDKYRTMTAKQWHDNSMEVELMCRQLRARLQEFDPQFVTMSRGYPLSFLDHINKFNEFMDKEEEGHAPKT